MITSFFLSLVYGFIGLLLALLPTGGAFPASWTAGVYSIWGDINVFAFIVPVDVLVLCLGIAMAFHLFVFAWKFMHWVYSLIRGSRIH